MVPQGLVHFPMVMLTGDEDLTDEDGDIEMGDSIEVLVFLSGEIPSGGKKSQEEQYCRSKLMKHIFNLIEPLPEDILGVTTLRDAGSHYPKRYWESLPEEILGVITRRDTKSHYPKRYWDVLWENRGNLGNNISG
ncbi:hypothetical protein Tco_0253160 [Tanacetum coccineum]